MIFKSRDTHFKGLVCPSGVRCGRTPCQFAVPRLANNLLPGFASTVSVNAAIGFTQRSLQA
jgi:hypothetical protein